MPYINPGSWRGGNKPSWRYPIILERWKRDRSAWAIRAAKFNAWRNKLLRAKAMQRRAVRYSRIMGARKSLAMRYALSYKRQRR